MVAYCMKLATAAPRRRCGPFKKAGPVKTQTREADFGDGLLMRQGYSLLWMGWQWDVPDGRMRMNMPVETDQGAPILGLVRGNFILDARSEMAPLADRGHKSYRLPIQK